MFALRALLTRLTAACGLAPAASRTAAPDVARRRRAALTVCIGLVAVAVCQVGLGGAIDAEQLPLRDPIYFDKLAIFRTHPAFFTPSSSENPLRVLFIGSSRTLNAVNTGAATDALTQHLGRRVETFNFGQAGAGPVTNAVYVRRLMQEGVQTDFVLIEVHPIFLAGQRADPPETRWLLPLRLRRDELPLVRAMGFPAPDPAVHGPRGLIAPWFEYRFLIVDRYAPFLLMTDQRLNGGHESDQHGFARLREVSNPADRPHLLRLAREQYSGYFEGFRPNGCGVAAIRNTLEQCQAAGWRAALVLMPESSEWLDWYDADGLRELDAVLGGLAAEFGVPVFDTRRWMHDHQTIDGHHLTGQGADEFTAKFTRETLAPWMAKTP